jgi:hypothetical protein
MRTTRFRIALVMFALWMTAPSAAGAQGGVELGYDFNVGFLIVDDVDETITVVGLPAQEFATFLQNVRAGWYLTDTGQLETSLGLSSVSIAGESFLQLGIGADWVQQIGSSSARPFVRFGGLMSMIDADDADGDTQFGIGAGAGVRPPIGDRLAVRVEAGVNRQFESDRFAHTDVLLSIGLSFFSR